MTITEPTPKTDNGIISSELAGTAIDSLTDLIDDEQSEEYEEVYEDLDEEVDILREFNEDMKAYTDALDNYNTQSKLVDWDSVKENSLATIIEKMELKAESAADDATREEYGREVTSLKLSQDRLGMTEDSAYTDLRNDYVVMQLGLQVETSNETWSQSDPEILRNEFLTAVAHLNADAQACKFLSVLYPAR